MVRVVEKHDLVKTEIPIRTRFSFDLSLGRDFDSATRSRVSVGVEWLDESKRTSTAAAAVDIDWVM
jgi:hypothetical protein